jgi:hypothetical protein
MRRIFYSHGAIVELSWGAARRENLEAVVLRDVAQARAFVRRLADHGRGALREVAYRSGVGPDVTSLTDREVEDGLARCLVDRRLTAHVRSWPTVALPETHAVPDVALGPSPGTAEHTWVAIRLLDEEGRPLAGARYRIKLPSENWRDGTLDRDGRARFECLESGSAQLEFPEFDDSEWFAEAEAPPAPEPTPPDHFVAFRLLDEEGRPMAGARYRIKTPGGGWFEGALDGDGRARIAAINEGVCKLEFTDFSDEEWAYGEAPAVPAEPPPPDHFVAFRLLDDDGRPMAGARYRIKTPGGGWLEGALDGNGRARIEGINEGVCKLEFTDVDEADLAPA